jgi:hypothetical protein
MYGIVGQGRAERGVMGRVGGVGSGPM